MGRHRSVVVVPVLLGTSGWQYRHWRGRFYPAGVPQRCWLEYYADRFSTVEVNNAFYRLPDRAVFEAWRNRTPADFVVTVKASRYLSHVRRLRDPAEPVQRLVERAGGLGPKLGPFLLQLPPDFRCDLGLLDAAVGCFPAPLRVAVEVRHASWWVDGLAQLLSTHNAALCLADSPARRGPVWKTADWGYIRFHAGRSAPVPCYGRGALASWASRLAEQWAPADDVFAYFNNDGLGCALRDSVWFAQELRKVGLEPTRVPASVRETPVG